MTANQWTAHGTRFSVDLHQYVRVGWVNKHSSSLGSSQSRSLVMCVPRGRGYFMTHTMCVQRSPPTILDPRSFTDCPRLSRLQMLRASTRSLQAKRTWQHRSSSLRPGRYLQREIYTMGCLRSTAIARTPTSPSRRRSVHSLAIAFPGPHNWQNRTSTLFSTRNTTAKVENAGSLKPMFIKTVRRRQGWN